MNRRDLLKKLGIGAVMLPVAPAILANIVPAAKAIPIPATAVKATTTQSNKLTELQAEIFALGIIQLRAKPLFPTMVR